MTTTAKKRILFTAIFSVAIFLVLTFFWPWYWMTDVPQRYGVPFVFREVGCTLISCVHRFSGLDLLFDILLVIAPIYGIVSLVVRGKPSTSQKEK